MAERRDEEVFFRFTGNAANVNAAMRQVDAGLSGLAGRIIDVRGLLGTLGAAITAQQFASMVIGTTEAMAKYKDLGDVAGSTASKISGLEAPARLAGTSLDTVASSVAKLGKSIGEARLGDSSKSGLFRALGIDPDDGRDAAEVMVDVAQVLSRMKDQTVAGKIANDLLGKSYAELRPFMKELAEQGELVARITDEEAAAADQFQDNLARLSLEIDKTKIAISKGFLPVLNDMVETFTRGYKEAGLLEGAMRALQQLSRHKVLMQEERELAILQEKITMYQTLMRQPGLLDSQRIAGVKGDEQDEAAEEATRRVRAMMEFEKTYAQQVAAARAFGQRYAEAIQVQGQLAQEARRQNVISEEQLIRQLQALEDAKLAVQIQALKDEVALHARKGDLAAQRIAGDKIRAAEAARVAKEAIENAAR